MPWASGAAPPPGPLKSGLAQGLRLYAHPGLLAAAATINGLDFNPFSESIQVRAICFDVAPMVLRCWTMVPALSPACDQIKFAGLGPFVTWHQDGTIHWGRGQAAEHGFNFMCQLYGSTAENGVWYVGSAAQSCMLCGRTVAWLQGGSWLSPVGLDRHHQVGRRERRSAAGCAWRWF